jgi:hypothetical protein
LSGGRNYSRGDRAALIAFSAGTCYWPGCRKPIVERAAGTFKVTLDIAHICALNETGERFDPGMSDDERNAFENLIVLCRLHHQVVDEGGAGAKYSVELLKRWKHERERGGIERLKGLQGLTESRLAELVNEAIKLRDADVTVILGRLERRDSEAADLMNSLLEELNAVRSSSVLNVDAVEMLHESADQLSHLPDSVEALRATAREFASLDGTTSQLAAIVDTVRGLVGELGNLDSSANRLQDVATGLQYMPATAERLNGAADKLVILDGNAETLKGAAELLYHLPTTVPELKVVGEQIDKLETAVGRLQRTIRETQRAKDGNDQVAKSDDERQAATEGRSSAVDTTACD